MQLRVHLQWRLPISKLEDAAQFLAQMLNLSTTAGFHRLVRLSTCLEILMQQGQHNHAATKLISRNEKLLTLPSLISPCREA